MIKLIPLVILLIMAGCGGGVSTEQTIDQTIISPKAIVYSYKVTSDFDSRIYAGRGVSVNNIIYMYPTLLAGSDFIVVGEISGSKVRLFSYISRELVVEFYDGDASGYHLELNEVGLLDPVKLDIIPEQWFNSNYAGAFGDIIMSLTNIDNILSGNDTSGCIVSGGMFEVDSVIAINLTLSSCIYAGDYRGSLVINDNAILGSVTSDNNGIMLSYTF